MHWFYVFDGQIAENIYQGSKIIKKRTELILATLTSFVQMDGHRRVGTTFMLVKAYKGYANYMVIGKYRSKV